LQKASENLILDEKRQGITPQKLLNRRVVMFAVLMVQNSSGKAVLQRRHMMMIFAFSF
jgi:hypothetical protein